MPATVFDKDSVRIMASGEHTGQKDPTHRRLHGLGIVGGDPRLWVGGDPKRLQDRWVRTPAGEGQNVIIGYCLGATRGLLSKHDCPRADLYDAVS